MHTSYPVEADRRSIGVAVHPSAEDIDGATFPSPDEARRAAGLVVVGDGGPLAAAGAKR